MSMAPGDLKAYIIETSKAINTNWLSADIAHPGSGVGPVKHTLYIFLKTTDAVVKLELTDVGNSVADLEMDLNGGVALTAGALYGFDLILVTGQAYNIQHETATQNVSCWITESVNVDI